jgi:type IV secretory pathway protease TraF
VASTAPREDNVIRPARWRVGRVAAMVAVPAMAAAAAALVLVVSHPRQASQPAPSGPVGLAMDMPTELPSMVVACPNFTTQESCAESAAARGLLVQYPVGMGKVPRYEGSAGLPSGALPSPPASL